MGAGHAYNIDKHMLVQPEDLTDYSAHQDFVSTWKGKPLEEQLQALKDTDLFFPEGEDILEAMDLVEIESNGKTFHSLDIEKWVDEYYADGVEFDDGIRDLKEQIVENAMEAGNKMAFTESFDSYAKEEREGDILVLGDGAYQLEGFSEVRFKAGLLSDRYNTGVVVFMQDAQGENYLRDIDDEDLLNIVVADFATTMEFQQLLNVKGSLQSDIVDEIFLEMSENMEDDEIETVLGDKVDVFKAYVVDLENQDRGAMDETMDRLMSGYDDVEKSPEELYETDRFQGDRKAETRESLANEIINRLEAAKAKVSDLFEGFADRTMDGVINGFRDETFRFATSAWTSAPYKKDKVLFSGPVKETASESPGPSM